MGGRSVTRISPASVRAVVLDYGNTLIEFSQHQIAYSTGALATFLRHHLGPFDRAALFELEEAHRIAPYLNGYRESDLGDLSVALVRELYGRAPTPGELDALLQLRIDAFVASIEVEPEVLALLGRLSERVALGLLSNYPSGVAIRRSLEKTGILPHLRAVVVSGDLGYVKPHPVTFETVLSELGVSAEEAVHVGDNWLADVQGAKRCGIRCAHMRRWLPPEEFEADPSDHKPDWVISSLDDLGRWLL
jgi:HAD superfamily hydrolase (TIGR01509 family)